MKKSSGIAVATLVLTGLSASFVATPAVASEKPGSVKVAKIKSKKAAYGKKVTIKPNVTKKGKVKISSKLITVKQGKKTIVNKKKSAKLRAGTYRVTTTVKYKVAKKKTRNVVQWRQGGVIYLPESVPVSCTITDAYEDIEWDEYSWEAVCADSAGSSYLVRGDDWEDYEEWVYLDYPSAYVVGKKFTGTLDGDQSVYRAVKKTVKKTEWVYGKTKTKNLTQTLKITQGKKPVTKKPSRVTPNGWNCPSSHPIKGNASSMIYHVPGGAYYSRTNPEECFATESAAKSAGYRKSKR